MSTMNGENKRIKISNCNICLCEQTELKCNECTFECCYKCINEWSERSHDCPQCKKFETYDIEYSTIISEEEISYDPDFYNTHVILFNFFNDENEEENEEENENEEEESEEERYDDQYDQYRSG